MRRQDTVGWWLFVLCAVLFMMAGVRDRDPLVIAGSAVFLVACAAFLLPDRDG